MNLLIFISIFSFACCSDIFIPNLLPEYIKYDPNYEQTLANIFQQLTELRPAVITALNGTNTTCILQTVDEIKILIAISGHLDKLQDRVNFLQYLVELPPDLRPSEHQDPIDGSFGTCYMNWFLKLEISTDIFLQANYTPEYYPHFLDQVNDPQSLQNYLDSLVVSDIALTGNNNGLELNSAVANLYRLISRAKPNGYKWNPGLEEVMLHFIYEV